MQDSVKHLLSLSYGRDEELTLLLLPGLDPGLEYKARLGSLSDGRCGIFMAGCWREM